MRLKNTLIGLLLILLITSSCSKNKDVIIPPITSDEYLIYQTIIDSKYNDSNFRDTIINPTVVILDSTNLGKFVTGSITFVIEDGGVQREYDRLEYISEIDNDSNLSEFISNEFRIKNKIKYPVIADSFKYFNKKVISKNNRYKRGRFWASFYEEFPLSKGYIDFSRVAYNDSQNVAFVYYQIHRQNLNAAGYYVFLRKINDKWGIFKIIYDWCS